MKILGLLFLFSSVALGSTWSEQQKTDITNQCVAALIVKAGLAPPVATEYCGCLVPKITVAVNPIAEKVNAWIISPAGETASRECVEVVQKKFPDTAK